MGPVKKPCTHTFISTFNAAVKWNIILKLLVNLSWSQQMYLLQEKKKEIWLSLMTKALKTTENSKAQSDSTKTLPKTSITQWLWTDLGQSVSVTTATQLMWLNQLQVLCRHSYLGLTVWPWEALTLGVRHWDFSAPAHMYYNFYSFLPFSIAEAQ